MTESNSFVHLHVHSEFSLLKASSRISDLVQSAVEFGQPALAITDLGNMFAAVDFFNVCQKKGVKPLMAIELIVTDGSRHVKKIPDVQENHSLLLYAKNYSGYESLMKLTSIAWTEGYHFLPRVDEETLKDHAHDLICIIAQKKGKPAALLSKGEKELALEYIQAKKQQFGEQNIYLEIVNHQLAADIELNAQFKELSELSGVPLVATNDSYYTNKEDSESHEILMAINEKMTISDPRRPRFVNREFYFKDTASMYALFEDFPEACENTLKIANDCNVELQFGNLFLPRFPIPENFDEDSFLKFQCEEALKTRYDSITDEINERLTFELSVIKKMGYSAYFLIVADFIQAARDRGIPVGPGRGSAAGSMVSYLLGITNLDPLRYGLFFERFLNPDRISMPDIDIDFCFRRREEVIDYVKEKYGAEKVAQIITYGKLKSKAVLKDVARVMEISFDEANEISKAVPADAKNLQAAIEESLEMQRWQDQYPKLFDVAIKLEGLARHTGIHAAGVVIAPEEVSDFVPLAGFGNNISTQYDGSVLESQGLLKMDFLGLSTLTVIEDALRYVEQNRSIKLDIDTIPLDDSKVFEILSNAQTAGLFQVDSDLFKSILVEMRPNRFEDIIALVALGRPGPLGMGMDKVYCESSHDPEKISYPHAKLEELLRETYGVLLYQEQVMNTAVILAGYTMAEADDLRKVMGKKIVEKMPLHREKFVEGAANLHDIEEATSNEIFNLMATFAQYGFNKSHSAAYGLICYQTAFLKAHYTQEFMAAALTDKYDSQEQVCYLIEDCQRMDIPIIGPDINLSRFEFTVDQDKILFGLGAIKEVGSKAIETILKARQDSPFESLRDFCYRVDLFTVNKKVIENLIKVGAFDGLAGERSQKLEVVDGFIKEGQQYQKNKKSGQRFLFEIKGENQNLDDGFPNSVKDSRVEQLAWEKELTGIYFSGHPLDEYRFVIEKAANTRCKELRNLADNTPVITGGMISNFRRRVNKKGEDWITFKISDFSGSVDCVVFARQFKKVTFKVINDNVVFISGNKKLQSFNGEPQIIVEDMELIDYVHESARWKLNVSLVLTEQNSQLDRLGELKGILQAHAGNEDLNLMYRCQGYNVRMSLPVNMRINPHLKLLKKLDSLFGTESLHLKLNPPLSKGWGNGSS